MADSSQAYFGFRAFHAGPLGDILSVTSVQTMILDIHNCETPSKVLRLATDQDLAEILAIERLPIFHTLVGTWPREEHAHALQDADVQYLIVIDAAGSTAGFAILRGILSPHRNIELKRFVIGVPDRGLGQRALAALKAYVFPALGAHRFWLDVFETNHRALHVYRKAGFRQEGVLREAIYRDGEFHTLLLLAMLDREYFSGRVL